MITVILLINSQNINGKIILVPRECNSTSLSERSVYGAIARQECSVTLPSRCSCRIILGVFRQKEYQQFRLKKPGGAGVKFFQAIKDVNQGCSVTLPARCRHTGGDDGCDLYNSEKYGKIAD